MPPKINSRHEFTSPLIDGDERELLSDRVPFRFQQFADNIQHVVTVGDSLHNIASRFYNGFVNRPAGLWWVLADFQPDPVIDPTLRLSIGTIVHVPSVRTLREEILNTRRRQIF